MKKLLPIFAISFLLLCWCTPNNNTTQQIENQEDNWDIITNETNEINNTETTIDDILSTAIHEKEDCDMGSKTFIAYAILWTWSNDNWDTEYYLSVNWEWYHIDERWNISDDCWFGWIPTRITVDSEWKVVDYEVAKDWTEYDSSTKEMFSDQAYKIRKDAKYKYNNTKSFLEQAEEYFNTKIIPEWDNDFECKFCDKLRYYNFTPEADEKSQKTNDLHFDYIAENNWKNTIYFWSDWTFEAKWSRDEWKWTWVFWKDENTVIVSNENLNHVYDRYIITNVDENNLNTILEIIYK